MLLASTVAVTHRTLAPVDIAIIAVYFIIIFGIGFYFARKGRSSEEYFLAGRNIGWSGALAACAPLSPTASCATLGASNRLRIDSSTPNALRMRLTRRVATSEWPPSSKKLSSIPTRPTAKLSAKSEQRISSCGVRGPR